MGYLFFHIIVSETISLNRSSSLSRSFYLCVDAVPAEEEERAWEERITEGEIHRDLLRKYLGEPSRASTREEITNMSIEEMERELAKSSWKLNLGEKPPSLKRIYWLALNTQRTQWAPISGGLKRRGHAITSGGGCLKKENQPNGGSCCAADVRVGESDGAPYKCFHSQ